ncbi:methionyl-tRNA formyltransferase (plasmid) [Ensifer adhaerens]|uniref:Formyltransferase family protein n=1 Tax=Ensifer adhaerens TaxID=106592 RepID=A0ABY8HLP7_ENSAD|nr:formyltransferase family protein [Ensifer adhaerens]ANK75897.1 methionyl-tRNA formyltransferase [Ensifer adhaerens]KDP73325.1 methionyl-tRNA formyltransferase [Ensifer adhaerens]WFP93051.1 formyltransferase family protein [Ensifer adhaerens]
MRFALVGAVEGSLIALNALLAKGMLPSVVVTLPPEAADRHSDFADLTTPARAAGSAVCHTTNVNAEDTLAAIHASAPDLVLVLGWSQICRQAFRAIPRLGVIGFHPSALPRLRGRGVIPWTILLGEKTTGSSLFWIDEGTDSGPIILQRLFSVAPDETARSLYGKHVRNLAEMVPEAVELAAAGKAPRMEQDHSLANYCAKRVAEDGLIDWRRPAAEVLRLIRAVGEPYPGAFSRPDGKVVHIDAARPFADSFRYIGLAAQVQTHTADGFTVMCGDRQCIEVTAWRTADGRRPPVHSKLDA